jgi:hypothetical protein
LAPAPHRAARRYTGAIPTADASNQGLRQAFEVHAVPASGRESCGIEAAPELEHLMSYLAVAIALALVGATQVGWL